MSRASFLVAIVAIIANLRGLAVAGPLPAQKTFNAHASTLARFLRAPPRPGLTAYSTFAEGTAPASSTAQLPNGASSISEIYGNWTVACAISNGTKLCSLNQAQGNVQTGAFAIELRTSKEDTTEGVILVPFGLKLEAGAVIVLDDENLGQGLRFSTCLPQGCLLPVSFPTIATDAMRNGRTLVVTCFSLAAGQPVSFVFSLNGFSAALDRASQLGK